MESELYTRGGYLANNPSWHVEDSAWKAKHILRMLDKNRFRPSTVCEVGCGAGEILAQLHNALGPECTFTGYDISPEAHALAQTRERDRLHFELGDILGAPRREFDLILLIDLIEHLEDYFSFLRTLKDRSRFKILHVPLDLSAQSVLRPHRLVKNRDGVGHLHYFTRETAIRAVEDAGYLVRDWFLTASSVELKVDSLKARLARLPRKLLFQVDEDLAARVLGGFSVMIFAE